MDVGDILVGSSCAIRITHFPKRGELFSAEVIAGSNIGYSSSTFDKRRWEGVGKMSKNNFNVGDMVAYNDIIIMVTGEGEDPNYNFAGTVIKLAVGYDGRMRVGESYNNFYADSYSRITSVVELVNPPVYPFAVGDLVMPSSDGTVDFIIRVMGLDTSAASPGECFAGEIVDRLGIHRNFIGHQRTSFRIEDFTRCKTTYERV